MRGLGDPVLSLQHVIPWPCPHHQRVQVKPVPWQPPPVPRCTSAPAQGDVSRPHWQMQKVIWLLSN